MFSSFGIILWIIVVGMAYRKLIFSQYGKQDREAARSIEPRVRRSLLDIVVFRLLRRRRKRGEIQITRH